MKKILCAVATLAVLSACDSTSTLYNVPSQLSSTKSVPTEEYVYTELPVQSIGVKGDGVIYENWQGIDGRRIIKIPSLASLMTGKHSGKVAVKMCVIPI